MMFRPTHFNHPSQPHIKMSVLIIVTNTAKLGDDANGTYGPEIAHAVHVLNDAGIAYTLASPLGGAMPMYGQDADDITKAVLASDTFAAQAKDTVKLDTVDAAAYAGVFYPGGYGLLFDLVDNAASHKLAAAFFARGAPVAAVCHGPATLSSVKLADGTALVKDKRVTGFTREEEIAFGTIDKVPFLLESAMVDAGAEYCKKANWGSFVVVDGNLITGQNPASAADVGKALVAALKK
jgi:putative intracellular protease/amidase